jgi:hypothetical protein
MLADVKPRRRSGRGSGRRSPRDVRSTPTRTTSTPACPSGATPTARCAMRRGSSPGTKAGMASARCTSRRWKGSGRCSGAGCLRTGCLAGEVAAVAGVLRVRAHRAESGQGPPRVTGPTAPQAIPAKHRMSQRGRPVYRRRSTGGWATRCARLRTRRAPGPPRSCRSLSKGTFIRARIGPQLSIRSLAPAGAGRCLRSPRTIITANTTAGDGTSHTILVGEKSVGVGG